jgi:hypothetical protein
MSFTLQHNCPAFITNHNIACSTFIAYHIYVCESSWLSALKMAPISKKHRKQRLEHPLIQEIQYKLYTTLTNNTGSRVS